MDMKKLSSVALIGLLLLTANILLAQSVSGPPKVKVVPLEPGDQSYFLLLNGPPETGSMRSGLVTLAPGKSIGVHNTEKNEEMIVPLQGQGELQFKNRTPIVIKPGLITYAPAHTEHNVVNTGTTPLKYIFIVAKAE
jgi:mannose-6-phosphate isomerase-like protein (cupin superfamily)